MIAVNSVLRCVHLLRKMSFSTRLVFVAVALLTAPIASRGQPCDLPTLEDTVCQISCDPGYTPNIPDCSCELTDGCEAAGQPCQNGGTCTSDLSAIPYYSCQCDCEFIGQNCEGRSS